MEASAIYNENKRKNFINNFDPYNPEHMHCFMYYKQKHTLPANLEFEDVTANYDIACSLISNKIVYAWYERMDDIERRESITPRTRSSSGGSNSSSKDRSCIPVDTGGGEKNIFICNIQ